MSELEQVKAKCESEIKAMREELEVERCERFSAEREVEVYRGELEKAEMKMEFMRGQIEAFKFCVACGKSRREKNE